MILNIMSMPSLPPSVYVAGVVAFLVAVVLVFTKHWHGHFSMDGLVGIQKNHNKPTPRIGGVSVFTGVIAAYMVAQPETAALLGTLVLGGLPAFAFGLAEDVTKKVDVMARLLATMNRPGF